MVEPASGQRSHRTHDSVDSESASTTIYLASGSPLRSVTDSGLHRDGSMAHWSVESGRKAPIGGLALTPPDKSTRLVEPGLSDQRGHRTHDSVDSESASTTIYLASGSPLRSVTDSGLHRDGSMARWSVESGRRAPVGGLALTPPSRSPERSTLNAVGLANVSTVDRGCSPFRYSELLPLGIQRQTDAAADTWRSWRTMSPPRPRCSFAKSMATGSDFKTRDDRRSVLGSFGAQSTDLRRSPSPTRHFRSAIDYRRDARERQRHLQVLESNRTLEKFMRVLRQEKEAKATAALFATPCTTKCRQNSRTISFAMDGESRPMTSSAVTSSRAGTGNTCRSENKPTRLTVRCNSPTARQSVKDCHLGLDKHRHQTDKFKALYPIDVEEDWAKCLYDRRWRASTARPPC